MSYSLNQNSDLLFGRTLEIASNYLNSLPNRPVQGEFSSGDLTRHLMVDLPNCPRDPLEVIEQMALQIEPGLISSAGPRFFGFVVGGSLPGAVAADWLTSAWDQNAQAYALSPSAAIVEETVSKWILDLLGLPPSASVGLVTGGQMANFVGLAAARHEIFRRLNWDVESEGISGAPEINVILGECAHGTIWSSLRMLGLGTKHIKAVPTDRQGRMLSVELEKILIQSDVPSIICAQAGNVNTGAIDPFEEIAEVVKSHSAWLHVDGAFGLWANASPILRQNLQGVARADSWATDAHKWLNVPYDCGIAIVANKSAHEAAMTSNCAYVETNTSGRRDGMRWAPENSRRARGFVLYAALQILGRQGVQEIIERSCQQAKLMAMSLAKHPNVDILNEVCLNQVLIRFKGHREINEDALNQSIARKIQKAGICWVGTTTWNEQTAIRISFSNWSTSDDDVKKSAAAILEAADWVLR